MHGIDEGELEIEPHGHYASSLLYWNTQTEMGLVLCFFFHGREIFKCCLKSNTTGECKRVAPSKFI